MNTSKIIAIGAAILTILLLFTSCESDNEGYISLSEDLRLSALEKDSAVHLNWTLTKVDNFQEYRVYRSKDKGSYYHNSPIYVGTDFFEHTFIDESPNFLGMNYYWVEARGNAEDDYYRVYKSNIDSVRVGNYPSFSYFPASMIFNKEDNLIGFIDGRQKFTLYNYQDENVVATKTVSYNFAHPCFGTYNGQTELYLNENSDNSISVYAAKTMKYLTRLSMKSQDIFSIAVNNNGKVYVAPNYGSYLEVLDRGHSVSSTINSSYDQKYLKYSDVREVLIANEYDSYSRLYEYFVTADGNITSENYVSSYFSGQHYACVKEDPLTGNVYLQPNGMVKLLNNSYIANSVFGKCQDIAFSSSFVYTAPFEYKALLKYDRNGQLLEAIDLPGYPVYIFIDDNQLIVIFVENPVSYNQSNSYSRFKGYNDETAFGICKIDI
ncbi:hypothetical protein [Carboxylicivirga taeanensis]|uniref:hypothetical protein n=1 Tax=Carboxylicivirga taeanensis TaxID=1416875 RepID=UPI003F6E3FFB